MRLLGSLGSAAVTTGKLLEAAFDKFRFDLKLRFGTLEPVEILAYRGHGNRREVFIKGRVLEESGITRSAQTDTVSNNLRNMGRRFFSSEIPHAKVRGTYARQTVETTADDEGFFDMHFAVPDGDGQDTERLEWEVVHLELLHPFAPGQTEVREKGWVLVPGPDDGTEFGIISDVDDTIVRSQATNVLKMAWIVLLNNAHTRLPFDGVATFYHALKGGSDGRRRNPLFYVSSSPWNIYDLLVDFMDVHGLPQGPVFLKDWSPMVLTAHEDHKLERIRTVLATYPKLDFVLLGDSGEEDPEIYRRAAIENPGRIRAIIIRDVTGRKRDSEVRAIVEELRGAGVEMIFASDSGTAAEESEKLGLITSENARSVLEKLP